MPVGRIECEELVFTASGNRAVDDWVDSWTQAEALSDGISDYSMYNTKNVLRLEEFYRRQGYDLSPPVCGAGRGEEFNADIVISRRASP